MSPDVCLLLTGTIRVEHPHFLRPTGRVDAEQRLADYVASLTRWITRQSTVRDIVFAENSGHPLDALHEVVDRHSDSGKRVELLSFKTTGYTEERGRSFGELDIIDRALGESTLLRDAPNFAKVTGRVFVPNFDSILGGLASDFDIVGRLSHNLTWMETVLAFFRRDLFRERILPYALEHVNDKTRHHIERVIASASLHAIAEGARWYPFPVEPRLHGVRGLDGRPYAGGVLRAKAIDFFSWGHHRALDVSAGRASPHPMERWSSPRDAPESPSGSDHSGD